MGSKEATVAAGPVVERLPLTQARINLGSVVKRVHLDKAYVILEKDGIPVAALMDVDEFEDYLELRDPTVQAAIVKSRRDSAAGRRRPLAEVLKEMGKKPWRRPAGRKKG